MRLSLLSSDCVDELLAAGGGGCVCTTPSTHQSTYTRTTRPNNCREERRVPIRSFFLGYRKVDLKPHEVITAIILPLPQTPFEFVQPYKQARRREDDISIVTGCIRVRLSPSGDGAWVVEEAGLGFGGMAPTTMAAPKTEAFLQGKVWSHETIAQASAVLRADLAIPANVPGGQAEYRRTLPPSFLLKFFVRTSLDLAEMAAADKARAASCGVVDMCVRACACVCMLHTSTHDTTTSHHLTVPAPRPHRPGERALRRPLLPDGAQALLPRGAALHGRPRGGGAAERPARATRAGGRGGGGQGPRGGGQAGHAQERAGAGMHLSVCGAGGLRGGVFFDGSAPTHHQQPSCITTPNPR